MENENLFLKWRGMSPEEREKWREGMSLAERSSIRRRIAADCRRLVEEQAATDEPQDAAGNGSASLNGAGEPEPPQTVKVRNLRRIWDRLPQKQREALEAEFHRRYGRFEL